MYGRTGVLRLPLLQGRGMAVRVLPLGPRNLVALVGFLRALHQGVNVAKGAHDVPV